jgi:hypothetical protein
MARVERVGQETRGAQANVQRVWRVRKDSNFMDAQLRVGVGATIEIHYFLDGALLVSQRWPTRELALTEAQSRLRDLQRTGWTTHW